MAFDYRLDNQHFYLFSSLYNYCKIVFCIFWNIPSFQYSVPLSDHRATVSVVREEDKFSGTDIKMKPW